MGGIAMISICVRLLQPWRIEVPTQSVPVSPPPNTTTSLPFAEMGVESGASLSTACVLTVRKSMAKCTPFRLRPSTGRSRGTVAPVQITVASKSLTSSSASTFSPTVALHRNLMPSFSSSEMRRATTSRLSSFMFGMP